MADGGPKAPAAAWTAPHAIPVQTNAACAVCKQGMDRHARCDTPKKQPDAASGFGKVVRLHPASCLADCRRHVLTVKNSDFGGAYAAVFLALRELSLFFLRDPL